MVIEEFTVKHYLKSPKMFSVMEVWTEQEVGQVVNQMVQVGTFRVIRNSTEILAIGGFIPKHQGVCEVVMFPGVALIKQYYSVCKILHAAVTALRKKYRRIEMVSPDTEVAHRFAKFLGFTEEGILRKYNTLEEDYVMYSIVQGD